VREREARAQMKKCYWLGPGGSTWSIGRVLPLADLLRKEVIQPQVPLRLPCYDFTPITDHTFGACPPCGLAQRLLVPPAFVV
jgi:hypothetical protein